MKSRHIRRQLLTGLLALLIIPPSVAQAQWTVHDPPQYVLQVKKRVEEANRWMQSYQKAVEQLTTLGGILKTTEELVTKQRNAITTMSSIGQTVRGMYQLKDQLEAIVTTRLRALKSIDDRLRNGIFDPEADLRDFDEYLRSSIGRTSQDAIATIERLMKMDNQLERLEYEKNKAKARKAWAKATQAEALKKLDEEKKKPEANRCAECISRLNQELAECEQVIGQAESEITRLTTAIEERHKKYNDELEERMKFGRQVQTLNTAWDNLNQAKDEIGKLLERINKNDTE